MVDVDDKRRRRHCVSTTAAAAASASGAGEWRLELYFGREEALSGRRHAVELVGHGGGRRVVVVVVVVALLRRWRRRGRGGQVALHLLERVGLLLSPSGARSLLEAEGEAFALGHLRYLELGSVVWPVQEGRARATTHGVQSKRCALDLTPDHHGRLVARQPARHRRRRRLDEREAVDARRLPCVRLAAVDADLGDHVDLRQLLLMHLLIGCRLLLLLLLTRC